ncbi:MAG: ATP synthase F0 subunit B [Lachnospiraceae bacterium]|nr:ATP synthase F0 subunit B [Lachnospiraceae bacterium]
MPLGIDITQILLHLFNVVLLFGGLYILLFAPVKKFMAKREEYYKNMDDEAKSTLSEAEEKKELYETKLANIDEEIAINRKQAAEELIEYREKMAEQFRMESEAMMDQAKEEAEAQRKQIVDSAKDDVKNMITEATGKILSDDSQSKLLDVFLDEAERSVANGK